MSSRVTDNKVQEAKKARDYLEVKVEAAELQKDLARLTKDIGRVDGDGGGMRPIDRVREAYISGLEIKSFQNAVGAGSSDGGGSNSSEPVQKIVQETSETRTRIIESLVKAGKSPKEIDEYLAQLGPSLEIAGMAKDPVAQLLLYSRFQQRPSEMQFKDVVETIKLVNDMKGSGGGQSGVAEIANALVEAFRAGKEQSQAANPGMSNFEAYQQGMQSMQTLLANQNQSVKELFTERVKTLEEKLAASDPIAYMKSMKEAAETLGFGGIDKEIALHKLTTDEKIADKKHEFDLKAWEFERQEKVEARKDRRQSQMLDRVMKGVETALESPVIKEAGKMVGSKIEGKVPDVRGQAARSQLTEPMTEIREFVCPKCSKKTEFTNADLVRIANSGGRWVCSTQGCGAAYILPKEGGVQK